MGVFKTGAIDSPFANAVCPVYSFCCIYSKTTKKEFAHLWWERGRTPRREKTMYNENVGTGARGQEQKKKKKTSATNGLFASISNIFHRRVLKECLPRVGASLGERLVDRSQLEHRNDCRHTHTQNTRHREEVFVS